MDVAKKNVANIPRLGAEFGERARDVIEGRFRAGIEKDRAFIGLERGCGDDAGPAEMLSIEDVNHRAPLNLTQHRRTAKRQSSSVRDRSRLINPSHYFGTTSCSSRRVRPKSH